MKKSDLLLATIGIASLLLSQFVFSQAGSRPEDLWASYNVQTDSKEQSNTFSSGAEYFFPEGLISAPDSTRYLIWTEFDAGRLTLMERLGKKKYRIVKQIPISIGKKGYGKQVEGDQLTPVGVYRVTSYIPEENLLDRYGLGAYPLNYPNNWDKLQERTGYGIWLHGLPKGVDQRPLLDSDGCVVVDNQSLTFLDNYISTGTTTVVLGNKLNWVSTDELESSNSFLQAVSNWEQSWESLDSSAYLANYHPDFSDFNRDLTAWSIYKTRVNSQKTFIDVSFSDLTAIQYPGTENMVSVRFYQNYKSSNYDWAGWKELLWQKDANGHWKIIFEGNG